MRNTIVDSLVRRQALIEETGDFPPICVFPEVDRQGKQRFTDKGSRGSQTREAENLSALSKSKVIQKILALYLRAR